MAADEKRVGLRASARPVVWHEPGYASITFRLAPTDITHAHAILGASMSVGGPEQRLADMMPALERRIGVVAPLIVGWDGPIEEREDGTEPPLACTDEAKRRLLLTFPRALVALENEIQGPYFRAEPDRPEGSGAGSGSGSPTQASTATSTETEAAAAGVATTTQG